jgi:parallel beta-helix repeat protein
MHKNNLLKIVIFVLIIGVTVAPLTQATISKEPIQSISSGNTLYVGGSGPGNYTKIQDAIENSSDGDTVYVYDDMSPYYENVKVNKIIKLIGENKETTIIDGGGIGDVVIIASNEVNISGFTIQNSGTSLTHDSGISIRQNCIIYDNRIINNWKGIYGYADHGNIIKNNNISDNNIGIFLRISDNNTIISNNIANNNRLGVDFESESGSVSGNCDYNKVIKNNFLNNKRHARFFHWMEDDGKYFPLNTWSQNYWDRPRIFPKLIFGFHTFSPWINIDWHPAKEPYDIEV